MTRSDLVDRILSISAMVSALAAVAVSVYEARIDRAHQRVSVWPYVTEYNSLVPGEPYRRSVENVGIGPALIRAFQVRVDGEPSRTWNETVERLTGLKDANFVYSTFGAGTVLLPGTTRTLLTIPPGDTALRFWKEMQTGRVSMSICYCSLYEECWLTRGREPEPMTTCPVDPDADFTD